MDLHAKRTDAGRCAGGRAHAGAAGRSTARATPRTSWPGCGAASSSVRRPSPTTCQLCEFVETYWRLHAVPNLSPATRDLYSRVWALHILPRLGDYGVRELTPEAAHPISRRARARRRRHGDGGQGHDDRAVDPQLRRQRGARRVQRRRRRDASRATSARASRTSSCRREVEQIRAQLEPARPHARVGARVLRAPARGGGLPPGLGRRRRARDPLRRHQAPPRPVHAAAASRWPTTCASGSSPPGARPAHPGVPSARRRLLGPGRLAQLAQAHLAGRARAPAPGPTKPTPRRPGCAPAGHPAARPAIELRDARVYEGIPLTQIAREVGTSVRMIEQHYAGVIANWDGKQRAPRRAARIHGPRVKLVDAEWTRWPKTKETLRLMTKSLQIPESPLSDSNRRPLPYHGSALPAELRGRSGPA